MVNIYAPIMLQECSTFWSGFLFFILAGSQASLVVCMLIVEETGFPYKDFYYFLPRRCKLGPIISPTTIQTNMWINGSTLQCKVWIRYTSHQRMSRATSDLDRQSGRQAAEYGGGDWQWQSADLDAPPHTQTFDSSSSRLTAQYLLSSTAHLSPVCFHSSVYKTRMMLLH